MRTQRECRAIIYLATHPDSNRAIIGHGYHLESVINSLKNAKSPSRATHPAAKLIREFGGVGAWKWSILSDNLYDSKTELFKTFRNEYDQIYYNNAWERINRDHGCPVNHEIIDWDFKEIVW